MGEIYANARRVAVWLGESTAEVDRGIDFVEQISRRCTANGFDADDERLMDQNDSVRATPLLRHFVHPARKADWQSVLQLMAFTWWDRLWVLQEILNASAVIFYCSCRTISYAHIANVVESIAPLVACIHRSRLNHPTPRASIPSSLSRTFCPFHSS